MFNARRTFAAIAIATLPILGAFGAASVAQATPNTTIGPDGPTGPCPIVNTDDQGNETVINKKPGDRSHGMVCGEDGEWHTAKAGGFNGGPGKIQTQPGLSRG